MHRGFDYDRLVSEIGAITARRIETGSWERLRDFAWSIGAKSFPSIAGARFCGVPVIQVADLEPDEVRIVHGFAGQEWAWTTRYRIPA